MGREVGSWTQGHTLVVSLLPGNPPPGSQIHYDLSMIYLLGNPLGFQIQCSCTKIS